MKLGIYLMMTVGLLAGLHQAAAQTSFVLSTNYLVAPVATNSVPGTPYSVTAFMNVDGGVDLATANADFNTLTVLTNDGSGNFVSNATYAVGSYPNSVAAADVNGDGYVDLICANQMGNTLTVLTNDGRGGFALNATYTVGNTNVTQQYAFSVVATDVNGDGYEDLVCSLCNSVTNSLIVLTNNGSGGFILFSSPGVGFAGGNYGVQSVTAADVNGDGKVDLIAANYQNNSLSVLTNNGSGGFALSSTPILNVPTANPASVTAIDVNGDGKVDLVTANPGGLGGHTLTLLTNNGTGGFVLETNIPVIQSFVHPVFVTAVDVNGDSKVDLICANQGDPGAGSSVEVLTNNGSGGFVLATNIAMGGSGANWIVAADFNRDGKMDIASANRYSNSVSVFFNASIFPPPTSTPSLNIKPLGNGIRVSWPSASAGWSLQQNPDLTPAHWGPSGYSGYTISDDRTNKSLTMPTTPGKLFFRLLHP
jgi:hypothetical protein